MIVTLHNLFTLKRPGEALRGGLRVRMRTLALQRAARLIVPTAAVARDAAGLLRVDADRIHVIPKAPDAALHPARPGRGRRGPRALRAPARLPAVGRPSAPRPAPARARARGAAAPARPRAGRRARRWARRLPDVHLTGVVSDDELAALYSGARALLLPADDEGFGLPGVEALACGTPVVACALPALQEVLGTRATFVDRDDLAGLIAAAEAAERPAPAPPHWSWADAADATWTVYERALASA